jgi:steroid delta-isomerase-like uncharacterized protein
MASQNLETAVREMYDAWNAKDLDRCASLAHADARMTNVPFGARLGFREYIESWARAFPDGKIDVENIVAHGDKVMTEFTGRGTHTGPLKGPAGDLPATQRRVELKCVESLRFRDGKLAEGRVYFDAFSFFTQLGIGAPEQGRATAETTSSRP